MRQPLAVALALLYCVALFFGLSYRSGGGVPLRFGRTQPQIAEGQAREFREEWLERLARQRRKEERESRQRVEARREVFVRQQVSEEELKQDAELREHLDRLTRAEDETDRRELEIKTLEEELESGEETEETIPGAEVSSAPAAADLSGGWEMTNTIRSTDYEDYRGLRLGYRIQLEQDGDRISGHGRKVSEDGRPLPAAARTPITITGRIEGRKVTLQFTEQGAERTTNGGFSWELSADRTALRGSFWSTAADTSGSSFARRM